MNWALAFGRSVAPALRTRPRAHGGATEEGPYGTLVKVVYVSRSPVPRASVRGSSMGSPVESAAGALDVVGRPFGFVLHGLFFGAGVLGLYALSRSLESLAAEHDAKVLEVLKAAEQTGEAETQEELKDTEDTEELRKRGGARGARGA
ncbi:unnamed protein product [Durusdinium trenchii]|uniref:Uncharacterized protein n=1 Tax=Durusdinium trenchii TaxID=1381693 RepID=A0ABP0JYY8_9DINO